MCVGVSVWLGWSGIRVAGFSLQHGYMSYRFASKPVWHIPLLCVQWKTPDDGQRNCPKHVAFYSKNKFEKFVHLVGFIVRISQRSSVTNHFFSCAKNLTLFEDSVIIMKNTVQHSTIQYKYNTVQYSTTQYNTIQYNAIQSLDSVKNVFVCYGVYCCCCCCCCCCRRCKMIHDTHFLSH